MFGFVPANPNEIILSGVDSEDFPTTMPARLNGLIAPADYAASIQRINAAKRPGPARWLGVLISISGFVLWAILLASNVTSRRMMDFGTIFGGMAAMIGLMLLGMAVTALERRRRFRTTEARVAEEHARYNAPNRPPISWILSSEPAAGGYGWGHRRNAWRMMTLRIEVAPNAGMIPQQQQQPPQGAVPYAVPFQAAYVQQGPAQAPFYNGVPGYAAPPQQFPQPHSVAATMPQQTQGDYGQEGQSHAQYQYHQTGNFIAPGQQPLMASAGDTASPSGYGSGNAPPSALVEGAAVGSCERCGHMAHSAQDRFCSACGGNIRR
jgi:hypothetical protein